jgi:hypothetical protein
MTAVLPCPQKLDAMSVEVIRYRGDPAASPAIESISMEFVFRTTNNSIGRSWGGLTSKIHAVVDANGRRVATRYD